jgi:hypothetical protein
MTTPALLPDRTALVALARELAMDIQPQDVILAKRGVTDEMYAEIIKNTFFSKVLTDAKAQWHSAINTPDRIKVEAAALLEDWLPDLYAQMNNVETPLSARIEGGKLLARLAGVGEHAVAQGSHEKFVIQINLGDEAKTLEIKEVPPISPVINEPLTIEVDHEQRTNGGKTDPDRGTSGSS